ncbi:E3 ubiquitin-protein ligase TRIM39-like [Nematostella vectensis]|nr:E3 ubiquitin-protein ligase TRIM39-like [Nematostella vectensis]
MPETERFVCPPDFVFCAICKEVLTQPIATPCDHYFCVLCICEWLDQTYNKSGCPVCKASISPGVLHKIPRVLGNTLASCQVLCRSCKEPRRLDNLAAHEAIYTTYIAQPATTTVREILNAGKDTPLSQVEERICNQLMKRKLSVSQSLPVLLFTGGTPLKICHVPRPRTNSSSASSKTVQRRASVVETLRQQISGGERDDILRQKKAEMQRMGQEERETIAQEAGLKIEVPEGQGLAMKADIGIPWNKLRELKRWLNSFGLQIASEKKQRKLAEGQKFTDIYSEEMPFVFSKTGGGTEIRLAVCAQVEDLTALVYGHLEENMEYNNLTWHGGVIDHKF